MAKIINIDTSDNKKITVELKVDKSRNKLSSESVILKSEAALPLIDKLLKNKNLKIEEIEQVRVNTGPGSYTGLRVGVAIANTLGFVLKASVNERKVGELVTPVYNK